MSPVELVGRWLESPTGFAFMTNELSVITHTYDFLLWSLEHIVKLPRVHRYRLISAAPYRDRVVHHALCNVIQPIFERGFSEDSYACRKGKGTHLAIERAAQFARRFRYVLKADVRRFFPTVDHDILLARVKRRLKDRQVLDLIEHIVRHPYPGQIRPPYLPGDDLFVCTQRTCGLPIGNQTSQFLANVMLDPLDQFVKKQLRIRGYVRYADDFLLFANDKRSLHDAKSAITEFLLGMRLQIHRHKSVVFPVRNGIPFLGLRIFPTHRRLARTNVVRFQRRLKEMQCQYDAGEMSPKEVRRRIVSWWGHAQHANAWRLARAILKRHPFVRVSRTDDPQP